MRINIGGVIPLQPIGGIITNNPATTTQAQIDAAQKRRESEEAQKDAMRERLAQEYNARKGK